MQIMCNATHATVFQTVQKHGVCSTVYGTMHYEEPLEVIRKE